MPLTIPLGVERERVLDALVEQLHRLRTVLEPLAVAATPAAPTVASDEPPPVPSPPELART